MLGITSSRMRRLDASDRAARDEDRVIFSSSLDDTKTDTSRTFRPAIRRSLLTKMRFGVECCMKTRARTANDRHGERGQILPLLGFGTITLLGIVALVVDIGSWQNQHRLEQSAADAAAIAGAVQQNYPALASATALPATVAKAAAAQNGFTDGVGGVDVLVNTAPTPAPDSHASGFLSLN